MGEEMKPKIDEERFKYMAHWASHEFLEMDLAEQTELVRLATIGIWAEENAVPFLHDVEKRWNFEDEEPENTLLSILASIPKERE